MRLQSQLHTSASIVLTLILYSNLPIRSMRQKMVLVPCTGSTIESSLKTLQIIPLSVSDSEVRKRQGGKGHERLDKPTKIEIILKNLPPIEIINRKFPENQGLTITQIDFKIGRSQNIGTTRKLVDELNKFKNVEVRDKISPTAPTQIYYYKTEFGEQTLQKLIQAKEMLDSALNRNQSK